MRGVGGVVALLMIVCLGCGSVSEGDDGDDDDSGTTADSGSSGNGDAGGGSADASPDAGDPADAMNVPATCEDVPLCGLAGVVGSAADIAAIAAECATWGNAAVDRFRRRTPTFMTSDFISVCPDDFALPADCQEGQPLCNAGKAITVDPALEGVDETVACFGAQFAAGVRFRVRFNIDPPTLGSQFRTAHIHFEPACDEECGDGQHRCEAIDHCYPDDNYCFDCGFGTAEECACLTPDIAVIPDCTECQYIIGDQVFLGQCLSGLCEQDPCNECPCE